jgi:IS30 family transposase
MARHLTKEERDRIAQLHHRGYLQNQIAEAVGRDPGTISRELARNCVDGEYFAAQAQDLAELRRCERPLARKLDDPELNAAIRRGLAQEWSPEQIEGAQQRAHPDEPGRHVSARTIYTWIEHDQHKDHWKAFLRRRGKRPYRRKKPEHSCPAARIKNRPACIEHRLRLGDFEGDTVLGPPGTGGIVTLVCRRSRFTIITKIQSKDADHVHARIKLRLKQLAEEQRRSITFDNGTEFARYTLPTRAAPINAAPTKTPTVLFVNTFPREPTSAPSPITRLAWSKIYSTIDPAPASASKHQPLSFTEKPPS